MVDATSPAPQTHYGFVVNRTPLHKIDRVALGTALAELLGKPIEVLGIEEGLAPDGQCGTVSALTTEELPEKLMHLNIRYREK